MPDEIGARIVVTGEDRGASSTVQQVADATQNLATSTDKARDASGRFAGGQKTMADSATAAARAQELLNTNLKQASPEQLVAVGAELRKLAESGGLAEREIGQVENKLKAVAQERTGRIAAVLAPLAAGAGLVASAVAIAGEALDKFASKQEKIAGLDAALAQSGELTEANRLKYQQLAGELGRVTGLGSAWIGVLQRLTQMGADASNIAQYADAVKNLAGLLGGDVDRAATVFGRALNGNYQLLARYGIEVDKTKDRHAQLDEIMAQLATRGGGQLEARTRTISGQFGAFSGAVNGLWSGLGNLISRTGVVQVIMSGLTDIVRTLGSVFPKTVEQVEGLTNKIPPLKDEFGRVKGAADEAGEEIDEVGRSSDSAGAGLGRMGTAAEKAKKDLDEATDAAKKLRQEQDAMADAQTALKLARVDADEANKKLTPEQANRQRAQIRADGEQAGIGRKVAEQDAIIQAQVDRRYESQKNFGDKSEAAKRAEKEFQDAANANGKDARFERSLGEESVRNNHNYLLDDKGKYEEQAQKARKEGRNSDAEDALAKATAIQRESDAYFALRQAQADAATAGKQFGEVQAEAQKNIDAAGVQKQVLAIQQRTAVTKAGTEETKLSNEAAKKREADERAQRDAELEAANKALANRDNPLDPAQRQTLIDRRKALENVNDAAQNRKDFEGGDSRDLSAARQRNRNEERAIRDTRDSQGGSDLNDDLRKILPTIPEGAPGSDPGRARALIQQILQSGGRDTAKGDELMTVLQSMLEHLREQGGSGAQRDAQIKQIRTELDNIKSRAQKLNA